MPPLGASPPPPPEGGEEGFEMTISINDYGLITWAVLQPPVGALAVDSTLGICTAHLEYILMYLMGLGLIMLRDCSHTQVITFKSQVDDLMGDGSC